MSEDPNDVKTALARLQLPKPQKPNDRLAEAIGFLCRLPGAYLVVQKRGWRGPNDRDYHASIQLDGGQLGLDGDTPENAIIGLYEAAKRLGER